MALKTRTVLSHDKELNGKLECHERDVLKLQRKGKRVIFELAYELWRARNTCLEHDKEKAFGAWVEQLGISRSNAYRAISRWEALSPKILGTPSRGGYCPKLGQSPPFEGFLCFARFDDSALDELAKPSTPAKALSAAIRSAQSGKGMSRKDAIALIEKHAEPPQDTPEPGPASKPPRPPKARQTEAQGQDQPDYGKCPNCLGKKWTEDEFGVVCSKCNHPHGEPAGDVDEDRIKTQRQKSCKTGEALMRAFDDLQCMKARQEHGGETKWSAELVLATLKDMGAVAACNGLLTIAKRW